MTDDVAMGSALESDQQARIAQVERRFLTGIRLESALDRETGRVAQAAAIDVAFDRGPAGVSRAAIPVSASKPAARSNGIRSFGGDRQAVPCSGG